MQVKIEKPKFIQHIWAIGTYCPDASNITLCKPKCTKDYDCWAIASICCPNKCGGRSCIRERNWPRGSIIFDEDSDENDETE